MSEQQEPKKTTDTNTGQMLPSSTSLPQHKESSSLAQQAPPSDITEVSSIVDSSQLEASAQQKRPSSRPSTRASSISVSELPEHFRTMTQKTVPQDHESAVQISTDGAPVGSIEAQQARPMHTPTHDKITDDQKPLPAEESDSATTRTNSAAGASLSQHSYSEQGESIPAHTTSTRRRTVKSSRDYNEVDPCATPSIATRLFNALAWFPLVPLTLFLIAQTLGTFDVPRALWLWDEVRYASVYDHIATTGNWLLLQLDGQIYSDKPALYFLFLSVLDAIPGVDAPEVFFLGAALSSLFLLWATYALARATGYNTKTGFAAGLLLLTSFYFLGARHLAHMDMLFAACITVSHLCMYKGWSKNWAPCWLIAACIFATLATFIEGPVALILPIIAGVLFVLWQGKLRRLHAFDGVMGFTVMLLMVFGWLSIVWLADGSDYIRAVLYSQIINPISGTWQHTQPWWYYLVAFPAIWLPWTLVLFVLPWGSFLRNPIRPLLNSRKPDGLGAAYVWIALLSGIAILTAVSSKSFVYFLPIFPMLAILCAHGILKLSACASRVFYMLVSLLFCLLAVVFTVIAVFPLIPKEYLTHIPQNILTSILLPQVEVFIGTVLGAGILAGCCALIALLLIKCTNRSQPSGALLATTLFITLLAQPILLYTTPSLDSIMSPKAQADSMRAYIEDGYTPITYNVPRGTYSYYAGKHPIEIQKEQWEVLNNTLEEYPRAVLAMPLAEWNEWANRPASIYVVQEQWIVEQPYILAVQHSNPIQFIPTPTELTTDSDELIPSQGETAMTATEESTSSAAASEEVIATESAQSVTSPDTQENKLDTNAVSKVPLPITDAQSTLEDTAVKNSTDNVAPKLPEGTNPEVTEK